MQVMQTDYLTMVLWMTCPTLASRGAKAKDVLKVLKTAHGIRYILNQRTGSVYNVYRTMRRADNARYLTVKYQTFRKKLCLDVIGAGAITGLDW